MIEIEIEKTFSQIDLMIKPDFQLTEVKKYIYSFEPGKKCQLFKSICSMGKLVSHPTLCNYYDENACLTLIVCTW